MSGRTQPRIPEANVDSRVCTCITFKGDQTAVVLPMSNGGYKKNQAKSLTGEHLGKTGFDEGNSRREQSPTSPQTQNQVQLRMKERMRGGCVWMQDKEKWREKNRSTRMKWEEGGGKCIDAVPAGGRRATSFARIALARGVTSKERVHSRSPSATHTATPPPRCSSDWCVHARTAAAARTPHPRGEQVWAPGPGPVLGNAIPIPTDTRARTSAPSPIQIPVPMCACVSLHRVSDRPILTSTFVTLDVELKPKLVALNDSEDGAEAYAGRHRRFHLPLAHRAVSALKAHPRFFIPISDGINIYTEMRECAVSVFNSISFSTSIPNSSCFEMRARWTNSAECTPCLWSRSAKRSRWALQLSASGAGTDARGPGGEGGRCGCRLRQRKGETKRSTDRMPPHRSKRNASAPRGDHKISQEAGTQARRGRPQQLRLSSACACPRARRPEERLDLGCIDRPMRFEMRWMLGSEVKGRRVEEIEESSRAASTKNIRGEMHQTCDLFLGLGPGNCAAQWLVESVQWVHSETAGIKTAPRMLVVAGVDSKSATPYGWKGAGLYREEPPWRPGVPTFHAGTEVAENDKVQRYATPAIFAR
ncbi:hypothetical protein B0H13DRAFT_1904346 [Mycena leptocephala]|nr:hypothetical protein B0H13DRAFT_1904346 [Mycena leptocephala]